LTKNLKGLGLQVGPWAMALAPLAGIVAALGLRRPSGGGFLRTALAMAPALMRLWRAFSTLSEDKE
jgi:hypothetical protein